MLVFKLWGSLIGLCGVSLSEFCIWFLRCQVVCGHSAYFQSEWQCRSRLAGLPDLHVPVFLTESIKDAVGRRVKLTLKKKVKLEIKGDKVENRVLVSLPEALLCSTWVFSLSGWAWHVGVSYIPSTSLPGLASMWFCLILRLDGGWWGWNRKSISKRTVKEHMSHFNGLCPIMGWCNWKAVYVTCVILIIQISAKNKVYCVYKRS